MYMLDTNICIYIIKQSPKSVLERFESLQAGQVFMSVVTYGELEYGALKSSQSQRAQDVLSSLNEHIPVLPMPKKAAEHYASIRHHLSSTGRIIGNNDLWIAAHARALGLTLVSNNTREFERVEGVVLEDWV